MIYSWGPEAEKHVFIHFPPDKFLIPMFRQAAGCVAAKTPTLPAGREAVRNTRRDSPATSPTQRVAVGARSHSAEWPEGAPPSPAEGQGGWRRWRGGEEGGEEKEAGDTRVPLSFLDQSCCCYANRLKKLKYTIINSYAAYDHS